MRLEVQLNILVCLNKYQDFNMVEFDQFKKDSGHNYFAMTPTKWNTKTCAIGVKTKSGKYGGGTNINKKVFEHVRLCSATYRKLMGGSNSIPLLFC